MAGRAAVQWRHHSPPSCRPHTTQRVEAMPLPRGGLSPQGVLRMVKVLFGARGAPQGHRRPPGNDIDSRVSGLWSSVALRREAPCFSSPSGMSVFYHSVPSAMASLGRWAGQGNDSSNCKRHDQVASGGWGLAGSGHGEYFPLAIII